MDEFRAAIAKITIEGTNVRGTGFLVAPDMVATALHVVADRKV
jgi:V8-like Glu-specific endopeptidase